MQELQIFFSQNQHFLNLGQPAKYFFTAHKIDKWKIFYLINPFIISTVDFTINTGFHLPCQRLVDMRRFRGIRAALLLCLGVQNTQGYARVHESGEEVCLNPDTKQQCSNNGICRPHFMSYDEIDFYECDCYSYDNQPAWFGPDEWSTSTEYRGLSGQWCQCKREECPRNLTVGENL